MNRYATAILISLFLLLGATLTLAASGNGEPSGQPLVSATELDNLSVTAIQQKYPTGIRIYADNLTSHLKEKLLSIDSFPITWLEQNNQVSQNLVKHLIGHDNLIVFLNHVYQDTSDRGPGCADFIPEEMITYGLRDAPCNLDLSCLQTLQSSDYEALLEKHHWWQNLGFPEHNASSRKIMDWLENQSRATASIHHQALMQCGIELSAEQLEHYGKLAALSYLSNTIRGWLYYQNGTTLTRYRKAAVDVLPESSLPPLRADN